MRHILATLAFVIALALSVAAQQSTPVETVDSLSSSAERDLNASIAELNALRDQIAAEKLPIAQEFTALEELVLRLRREQERVSRLVDSGALEITGINAEIKATQADLEYVGSLLDEYARTVETKINVCELQYLGEPIIRAKHAAENTTATLSEKFAQQLPLVKVSLSRLFDAIGGMRFPGVAVDLLGAVSEGQFAILGPVALFRSKSGIAGLVVPQTGSDKPLVRPLEGTAQLGLAALVETGTGSMPLDPSKGGALKALIQEWSLIHIFEKGGPIMWPLLICSILALGAVIERLIFLFNESRRRDSRAQERLFTEVGRGDIDAAIRISKDSKDYVVRALTYALEHKESSLPNALLFAQARELKRFKRGITVLDTVITLAPLLGLLGTVTGMMASFSIIGGDLNSPGAITGGIAEALIATAFGLGIAILSLLPFNYLNNKMDEATHDIESASTQLKLLVEGQPGRTPTPTPGPAPAPAKSSGAWQELVGAGKG